MNRGPAAIAAYLENRQPAAPGIFLVDGANFGGCEFPVVSAYEDST